jgi:hypothetical protein
MVEKSTGGSVLVAAFAAPNEVTRTMKHSAVIFFTTFSSDDQNIAGAN